MELPYQNVSQAATLKKKKKKKKKGDQLVLQSGTSTYCILCRKSYWKNQAQEHLHSVLHHKELEDLLGINTWHECYACEEFAIGLSGYTEHISTPKHNANLRSLISLNVKPTPLCQILSQDLIEQVLERNRRLKHTTKLMKKKNKRKQAANAAWANYVAQSNGIELENTQQVIPDRQNPTARNHQAGSAVVPNQENKVSTLQDQSHTLPQSHQIWHNPFSQNDFGKPAAHVAKEAWAADYNKQYVDDDDKMDFTSDELSESGAIVFEHGQKKREEEEAATASTSADAAREVDMTSMLWHIRRYLGVREPCRADREARKQSVQAAAKTSGGAFSKQATTQTPTMPLRPSHATAFPASAAHPARAKQTIKGPSNRVPLVAQSSQTSPSLCPASTTGLPRPSKVRVAHKPVSNQGEKEAVLKATSGLYGGKKELTLREAHTVMKRKTLQGRAQEMKTTMPRFGIALPKPPAALGNAPAAVDLTLSEGFHWESIPDGHLDELPFPNQEGAAGSGFLRSDSQTQATWEQADARQDGLGIPEIIDVSLGKGTRGQKACKAAKKKKRKAMATADVAEMEPVGSKKPKSNEDRELLQQLLDVSLKEEEVSKSLQDVDKSLVQARNVLQAAYLEVQKLIVLKQQYITEINSLRNQRIDILQGIQGGYSEEDEVASTSLVSISTQKPPPTNKAPSIRQPLPAAVTNADKRESSPNPSVSCNPDTPQEPVNQSPGSADLPPPSPCVAGATAAVQSASSKGVEAGAAAVSAASVILDSDSDIERNGEQREHRVTTALDGATGAKDGRSRSADCVVSAANSEPPALVVIDLDNLEDKGTDDEPHTSGSSAALPVLLQSSDDITPLLTAGRVKDGSEASGPAHVQELKEEELSLGAFASHSISVLHLLVYRGLLISCSGDKTARAYSLTSKERRAEFTGHTNKVNMAAVWSIPDAPARLFTGSSDQTIRCYDMKTEQCLEQISLDGRVLCLHVAWNTLFAGLSQGSVASYDTKTLKLLDVFECHGLRGVSCLDTAQEGARRLLLVGSYDCTISVRDGKNGLLLRTLQGHSKTVLCIQVASDLVFSGSSDASVHAYNIHTGKLIRVYKGHGHSVTSLAIVGSCMVTACLDKLVRVYDLQSSDCLQVYGGQSGMVTCVAALENVIYTGCSDGSIQAFKLNLSKNFRCWWQNCSLVFGAAEHLVQHVVGGHNKRRASIIKCCWRSCSEQLLGEELKEHVKSHVDKDGEVQPVSEDVLALLQILNF